MEFHPVLPTPAGTDSTNIPCPDSVLKGSHRIAFDAPGRKFEFRSPYANLPITPLTYHLTEEQVRTFHNTGVLVVRANDIWTTDDLKLIVSSVNEMDSWPEAPGKWMKYFEKIPGEKDGEPVKLLQRVENFTQYHSGLDYVLTGEKLTGLCSQLFDAPAILYKEKINYKLPGGAGFDPHQDVAAGWWMYGQSLHISVLIGIDAATPENGCLEVVYGAHNRGMLCAPWKELDQSFTDSAEWVKVETAPGDVVFFDSYVPHRSAKNNTNKPRRVLYSTYSIASEGDFRAKYYADKRVSFPPDIERLQGKKYEYKI